MGSIVETVQAELNFLDPAVHGRADAKKAYFRTGKPTPEKPQTNQVFIPEDVEIFQGSVGREFSLERNAFQWVHDPLKQDMSSEGGVDRYLRDCEQFLMNHLRASKVKAYDHVLREQRPPGSGRSDGVFANSKRSVLTTHCDITPTCAQNRVKEQFPEPENEDYLRGHWQIVNIWRPLVDVVEQHPLAVCDAATVSRGDLISSDMIYPTHTTEIHHALYNPRQQWFYLPHQTKDEVLLLKNFDSDLSTPCLHSAFVDPTSRNGSQFRKSIEVRCWVFYATPRRDSGTHER